MIVSYLDLVRGGLATLGLPPEVRLDTSETLTLTPGTYSGLGIGGSHLVETGGNVDFTYYIPEFVGETRSSKDSDHAVHSSTSCTMLRLDGNMYWRDYGGKDQTFRGMLYKPHGRTLTEGMMKLTLILGIDWQDERNRETIAEALRVLDRKNAWPRHNQEQTTWVAPLAKGTNGSSVTCEKSITNVLAILSRTNVLFSRCGIS